jgi:hypothetical protein
MWDATSCNMMKVNPHFGETYLLHRQGLRVNQAGNKNRIHLCEKLLPLLVESKENHKERNIVGVSIKI